MLPMTSTHHFPTSFRPLLGSSAVPTLAVPHAVIERRPASLTATAARSPFLPSHAVVRVATVADHHTTHLVPFYRHDCHLLAAAATVIRAAAIATGLLSPSPLTVGIAAAAACANTQQLPSAAQLEKKVSGRAAGRKQTVLRQVRNRARSSAAVAEQAFECGWW